MFHLNCSTIYRLILMSYIFNQQLFIHDDVMITAAWFLKQWHLNVWTDCQISHELWQVVSQDNHNDTLACLLWNTSSGVKTLFTHWSQIIFVYSSFTVRFCHLDDVLKLKSRVLNDKPTFYHLWWPFCVTRVFLNAFRQRWHKDDPHINLPLWLQRSW